jgi:hypothetical protein
MTGNLEAQREAENLKHDEVGARQGWNDGQIAASRNAVQLDLLRINKKDEAFRKEVFADLYKLDKASGYLPVIGLTGHEFALKSFEDVMTDTINANNRREKHLPPDAPEYQYQVALDKSIEGAERKDMHLKPDASELDVFKTFHPQDWYKLLGLSSQDAKAGDVTKAFERYTMQKYEDRMQVSEDMSKPELVRTLLEKSDPELSKALGLSSPPSVAQVTAVLNQRVKLRTVIGLEQTASDADVIARLHNVSTYPAAEAQRQKQEDQDRRFGEPTT